MQLKESARNNISLNLWICYYIILAIVQTLWTNQFAFPPTILRLGMIIAVFAPIYSNSSLILLALPFSIILRGNLSTDYQYLPDINSYGFYILIELSAMIVHYKRLSVECVKVMIPFILLMFYMGLIDFIFLGDLGTYVINMFIAILLLPFVRDKNDFHLLSAAFIFACAILAVYYIIMFDKFLVTWISNKGLERSGWNDPNYFSTLLDYGFLVVIMYLMGHLKTEYWLFNKKILIGISVVIFFAVVMSASRAGFICYVSLLFCVLVTTRIKWYWYFGGIGIIGTVVFYMYKNGIFDVLLYRLFEQENIETGGSRTIIWENGISNFNNQDFVNVMFGGGFWHRVQLTYGADLHNEFMSVLLDYGFWGLLLFILFIVSNCTLNRKNFILRNIPIIFFILALMSLSPFQYIYVCFLVIWIFSLRMIRFR